MSTTETVKYKTRKRQSYIATIDYKPLECDSGLALEVV